ncbi:MAG TPA: HAD hydrolase-like protein [Candidatus Limnocylindrales bacterium]|nr:HAD hydrolase-like protein [Candidatus Limnocylindrales bacterium]
MTKTASRASDRRAVAHRPGIRDLPQPDAVIFDLDGTLVDSVETRIEAWLQTFDEIGIPTSRDQLVPLIGLDGKRLAREVAALAGQPIDDERSEVIDKRSGEIYEGLNSDPRPLPGVRRLFDTIDSRGLKAAIATSSRKEQVKTSVDALGLAKEPTIVDASHVEHAKPEPDLLLRAAEELGIDPSRAWYVGDSTWDMVASAAAAMIPLAVTAGSVVSREALEGAGAATVVETLDEIADALTPPAGV